MLDELRRRNVHRVAIAYVASAWLLIQVVETLLPAFGWSGEVLRIVLVLLTVGFIPAVVLSWVFEWTPAGLRPESRISDATPRSDTRKFDRFIIATLVIAVAYFAIDKFVMSPAREQANIETALEQGRSEAMLESYGERSIAVLPFADMSAAGDQEYMADGMAEELLNLLAKIPDVRVISRSSSFFFKGKDINIPSVAEKLNVTYVLDGSVRSSGNQIRITAQLIDARTDAHVWSETYDRGLENIFAVQDEISAAIIQALKIELLGDDGSSVAGRVVDTAAYDAYLVGLSRVAMRTRKDILAAQEQFEEAIAADPDFAAARVQLAHAWLLLEHPSFQSPDLGRDTEATDRVVPEQLARAIELAPNLPEAHGVQGYYHMLRFRLDEAQKALDKAIELNPNYALAYNWRADVSRGQERFRDMLADREKAYALDPMSLQISFDLAREYLNFSRPEDADRVVNRMFALQPDHPLAYEAAIWTLPYQSRYGDALLMVEKAQAAHPENELFRAWEPMGFYFLGMFEEAQKFEDSLWSIYAASANGNFELAERLLEKSRAAGDRRWSWAQRYYARIVGGENGRALLQSGVAESIRQVELRNTPWRDRCSEPLVYDLRQVGGYDDAVNSMMAACGRLYSQRLEVGYFCPCDTPQLAEYLILDDRPDQAVDWLDRWLTGGGMLADLHVNPIFKLIADRPEYPELLERNAARVATQQAIYRAGAEARDPE